MCFNSLSRTPHGEPEYLLSEDLVQILKGIREADAPFTKEIMQAHGSPAI
jgi:hypothetical protein